MAGTLDLFFLDETGFSPSLPPTYTWARPGVRPVIPYENPRSRRVNTMAVLAAPGTQVGTALTWWTAPFTWRAEHFVDILRHALPGDRDRPRVVVVDNASIHRSKKVKAAAPELARQTIHLYYLPAYSPELNDIERVFRRVKHEAMPRRTFNTLRQMRVAADAAFRQVNAQFTPPNLLGPDA